MKSRIKIRILKSKYVGITHSHADNKEKRNKFGENARSNGYVVAK